jgi:cyanate lyase
LDSGEIRLLQGVSIRGSFPNGVTTDRQSHYYEIVQIYGPTLKTLIHEEFSDDIIRRNQLSR